MKEKKRVAVYMRCSVHTTDRYREMYTKLMGYIKSQPHFELEEGVLDNASYFGRIFARSGGLTDVATQAMKEQNIDFEIKPVVCDGIEACRMALLKLNKGILDGNFIEGMACVGGCICGAGCLTHGEKSKTDVDKYGREALEKTIGDAISLLK